MRVHEPQPDPLDAKSPDGYENNCSLFSLLRILIISDPGHDVNKTLNFLFKIVNLRF